MIEIDWRWTLSKTVKKGCLAEICFDLWGPWKSDSRWQQPAEVVMQKHRKAFNSESSCSGEQVQPRDLHSKLAGHWGSQSLTYIRNHSEKHRKIWFRHTFKLVEPPVVGELLEWIAILSKMFAEVNRFRQLHRVPAVRMVLVQHIKDRAEWAASNLCSEKQQITVIWWNVYYEVFVTVLFHFVIFCIVVYCIFCIILLYGTQSAAPWIWKQTLLQAGVWRDFHAGPRNAVDGNHKTKWWVSSEPNVTLVECSGLVCAFAVNRSDMISYSQLYSCSISCSACSGDCCAIETDKCEL